jgi:hypothetical protein
MPALQRPNRRQHLERTLSVHGTPQQLPPIPAPSPGIAPHHLSPWPVDWFKCNGEIAIYSTPGSYCDPMENGDRVRRKPPHYDGLETIEANKVELGDDAAQTAGRRSN